MTGFAVVVALVAVGLFAWLLTAGVWWLVRRSRWASGLDEEPGEPPHRGDGGS